MLRLKGAGEEKEKSKRDFHDPKYQEDFPVHWAAIKGDAFEVKKLIEGGAIARKKNEDGWTPFMCAAMEGRMEVGEYLVKAKGKDLCQAKDNYGWTPLHWACLKGQLEFARFLVTKCGAKIDVEDNVCDGSRHEHTSLHLPPPSLCLSPLSLSRCLFSSLT